MSRFAWYGYEAEVDEQATRACYAQAPDWDCICGHCRNFVALARERKLPQELLAILDSLSIPPEKATYVCELDDRDWKEKGVLYEISWRVAGAVVKKPESRENEGTFWGPPVQLPGFHLMLGHELHRQLRLAAGALDVGGGGRQGEQVPLHDHRLETVGTDIGEKPLCLLYHRIFIPSCS